MPTRQFNSVKIIVTYSLITQTLLLSRVYIGTRTETRHSKTMWTFDVDVLSRRGKQHSAVRGTLGEQPNTIHRLSVQYIKGNSCTIRLCRVVRCLGKCRIIYKFIRINVRTFLHIAFAFRCKPAFTRKTTNIWNSKFKSQLQSIININDLLPVLISSLIIWCISSDVFVKPSTSSSVAHGLNFSPLNLWMVPWRKWQQL